MNIFSILIILSSSILVLCENWMENSPGIAMDYRIHIDAGKEDCYYQYVHPGATIYTSMNVLKGGDGNAGFAVRDPQGQIKLPYAWKPNAEYEETAKTGGYYGICLDNQFSKFAAKLINVYITTFRHDLWEQYAEELEKLDVHVANFTNTIGTVDKHINTMLQFQSGTRAREARDLQLLIDNNSWVQYWSIGQCVALVATSIGQVAFLRYILSGDRNGKGAPRA